MTILHRMILCAVFVLHGKAEAIGYGMRNASAYKSMQQGIFQNTNDIENSFWQNINHKTRRGFCLLGREVSHG